MLSEKLELRVTSVAQKLIINYRYPIRQLNDDDRAILDKELDDCVNELKQSIKAASKSELRIEFDALQGFHGDQVNGRILDKLWHPSTDDWTDDNEDEKMAPLWVISECTCVSMKHFDCFREAIGNEIRKIPHFPRTPFAECFKTDEMYQLTIIKLIDLNIVNGDDPKHLVWRDEYHNYLVHFTHFLWIMRVSILPFRTSISQGLKATFETFMLEPSIRRTDKIDDELIGYFKEQFHFLLVAL
jgi:hypothetical protein